ncbi:MAG: RNA 2',3'-cyclic phosphodiesterase, partial [Alphaproteobacteria bacterium]
DWSMVRWTPAEQLHVTVKFLGDVPDADVPKVCTALERTAQGMESFSATFETTGCFPPRGPVRIVWAGANDETGEFQACAGCVESEMEVLGFPREDRPFTPHVTIGRVKDDSSGGRLRSAVDAATLEPVAQSIDTLTLMSSVLSPKGPTYAIVSRAALGGGRQDPT